MASNLARLNTVWRIEIAGLNIVHWGDNGPLTPELMVALGEVDILMLPADGAYHLLTAQQTDKVLSELSPSVVLPMHYYVAELEEDLIDNFGPLVEWLQGREGVKCLPGNTWIASRESLPPQAEILVLKIADSVYQANEITPPVEKVCAE